MDFDDRPQIHENPEKFLRESLRRMKLSFFPMSYWGEATSYIPVELSQNTSMASLCYSPEYSTPLIILNPDFCSKLTYPEFAFVVIHELLHYFKLHVFRTGNRDARRVNQAADREINSTELEFIKKDNLPICPPEGLSLFYRQGPPATMEELYEKEIIDESREESLLDSHSLWSTFENTNKDWEQNRIQAIAESIEETIGDTPSIVKQIIKSNRKEKINIIPYINTWANSLPKMDVYETYSTYNQNCPSLPGIDLDSKPSIFIIQDSSGSMSEEDMHKSYAAIKYIVKNFDVFYTSTDCSEKIKDENVNLLTLRKLKKDGLEIIGGGGTLMSPAIKYACSARKFDGIICLTDGFLSNSDIEDIEKTLNLPLLLVLTRKSGDIKDSKKWKKLLIK